MRPTLAVLLTFSLLTSSCATTPLANRRFNQQPNTADSGSPDRRLLISYLTRLPIGSRVRATLVDGKTVRGTLMQATSEEVVVQRRTRIPEPATTIPIDQLSAVDLDAASAVGKAVAIGVASGAAGALGMFWILVAMLSD